MKKLSLKWNAWTMSLVAIGIALLVDLLSYVFTGHSDLFQMLIGS